MSAVAEAITTIERQELAQLEQTIEQGFATVFAVGAALSVIRDRRLYRETHRNFPAYCRERWDLSKTRAHQLIAESGLRSRLAETVHHGVQFDQTPERTLRPLVSLPEDQQGKVFDLAVELAGGQAPTPIWMNQAIKQLFPNATTDDWYTPQPIIDAARKCMGGIDCDPASSIHAQEVVRAKTYFSEKDDGLKRNWRGRVWLNPPYSDPGPWVSKLIDEFGREARAAIVLVNNQTDSGWFHQLMEYAEAGIVTRGRIEFWAPGKANGNNRQGQAIFALGAVKAPDFAEAFGDYGSMFVPIKATGEVVDV